MGVFFTDAAAVMTLGKHLEALNEEACMRGYNWDDFLRAYLALKHPHLLAGMTTDPEGGIYLAL